MYDSSFSTPPHAFLFDFDGTLVDASEAICTSFNEVMRSRGREPLAHDAIKPMIGRPLREMFVEVGLAAEEAELDTCVSAYREAFLPRSVAMSRLLPSVAEVLPKLAGRAKLGIVTNRMSDGAWRILRAHQLDSHFTTVVGIERVGRGKPDPEPVRLALAELGVPPSRATLVGDTEDDIKAAISSGVRPVGVTTGAATRDRLLAAGAHLVVDTIDELADPTW